MADTYYSPLDVAVRWGVSYRNVLSLLRRGELHGFRVGKEWRVSESALTKYENQPPKPYRKENVQPSNMIH